MVEHTFVLLALEKQGRWMSCEFTTSQAYVVCSKTARATWKDPISKIKKVETLGWGGGKTFRKKE